VTAGFEVRWEQVLYDMASLSLTEGLRIPSRGNQDSGIKGTFSKHLIRASHDQERGTRGTFQSHLIGVGRDQGLGTRRQ